MDAPKVAYVASVKRSGKYIGSKLISWGTKSLEEDLEPCSHVCIILKKTLVIESTMTTGVRIIPYKHWIKENRVAYAFDKDYEGKLSQYIPSLMDEMWGKPYDYIGILYFTWRIMLFLAFRMNMPEINKWDSPGKRFCVEIFGEKLGMISPIQMAAKWKRDSELTEIQWED